MNPIGASRIPGKAPAVVGVGMTQLSSQSGTTQYDLALQAALLALDDAGMNPSELDGVVTYQVRDSVSALEVAAGLGVSPVRWYAELELGGPGGTAAAGEAAMAIRLGLADTLLVVRAMNGRSGKRMGTYDAGNAADDWRQWSVPYGHVGPPQYFALWAQRHMAVYGTTANHLGAVAVTLRQHAQLNPAATFYGRPLTMDDYLASRMITSPFRLLDCCLETDGAAAVVITSADRASDYRAKPVYIASHTSSAGPSPSHPFLDWPDHAAMFPAYSAEETFRAAGVGPADIDVGLIYDGFTFAVITQLEDLGFVKKGEGGPFVADGNIALGGSLPVNPNGGLLSEGYMHGLNNFIEGVRQLRGEAGQRQVPDAETAIVTGGEGARGSIAILQV